MRTLVDYNDRYRPSHFRDFWNQEGTVARMIAFINAGLLPKATILTGDYGTGKTSLARVVGLAYSCLDESSYEPCNKCEGCYFAETLWMGIYGGMLRCRGNAFDLKEFEKICFDAGYLAPPPRRNAHIVIIDEAHRINEAGQHALLDRIEDTPRTHFILCTTHSQNLCDGVRARCHEMPLPLPSTEQAVKNLARISEIENISIPEKALVDLVEANKRIPRNCLKALQAFNATGGLCKNESEIEDEDPIF